MQIKSWLGNGSKNMTVSLVVIFITLVSFMTGCSVLVQKEAPARDFPPEALLVDLEAFPEDWFSFEPVLPVGDDLVSHESVCQGFGKTVDGERVGSAAHCIYRKSNQDVAQRSFEHVYLTQTKLSLTVDNWTYSSVVTDQFLFWCANASDGSGNLRCEWGATYEEYIITFSMRLIPGGVSLADMEGIVEIIDFQMGSYLGLLPE